LGSGFGSATLVGILTCARLAVSTPATTTGASPRTLKPYPSSSFFLQNNKRSSLNICTLINWGKDQKKEKVVTRGRTQGSKIEIIEQEKGSSTCLLQLPTHTPSPSPFSANMCKFAGQLEEWIPLWDISIFNLAA
jgi:hypothetical protein